MSSDAQISKALADLISDPCLPTMDNPSADPRLFFEEAANALVHEWIRSQTERSEKHLSRYRLDQLEAEIEAQLGRLDRVPDVSRIGDDVYCLKKDQEHPSGQWKRTSFESHRNGKEDWEVMLDMDAINKREPGNNWTFSHAVPSPNEKRVIIHLDKGGSHDNEIREFDIATRDFVKDGFYLPPARGGVTWLNDDTLLVVSVLGEGMTSSAGWARTLRRWTRGQDLSEAKILGECGPDDRMIYGRPVPAPEGIERIQVHNWRSRWNHLKSVIDNQGQAVPLEVPGDSVIEIDNDSVLVKMKSAGKVAGESSQANSVVACSLSQMLQGCAKPQCLFNPNDASAALQSVMMVAGSAVIHRLDNINPVVQICTPRTGDDGTITWSHQLVPDLPKNSEVSVSSLSSGEKDLTLSIAVSDPLTPKTFFLWQAGSNKLQRIAQDPATFDATGLYVRREHAPTSDGESIPYFVIGPKGLYSNEAYLNVKGYGGFGLCPLIPSYDTASGVAWLGQGGTVILASIRGGGELGTRWHDAARGAENKHKSVEDFAAVIKHAHSIGLSRPERSSAWGGSNGGMVVLNMAIKYPELFASIVASSALTDMYRFTKMPFGDDVGIDEYGDPADSTQWEHMKLCSPYHQDLRPRDTSSYPSIFIQSSRIDMTVHPSHSSKFAHKLITARGSSCFIHVSDDESHSQNADHIREAKGKARRYLACGIPIGLFAKSPGTVNTSGEEQA